MKTALDKNMVWGFGVTGYRKVDPVYDDLVLAFHLGPYHLRFKWAVQSTAAQKRAPYYFEQRALTINEGDQ